MGKKVTIQDIAEATGISKSTISRVISNRGYVSEEAKEIILKSINDLGYKPQQKHKGKHVRDLVMIACGLLMSPIQITIINSIINKLESNGFIAMVSYNGFNSYRIEEHLLYARERKFAGVIILGTLETPKIINLLKSMECPIVLLNQELSGLDVNVVGMDDFHGGYIATKHLIENGHRRIGLIMGYEKATATFKRELGYREAMRDAGLKFKENDIYYGDFTEKSGSKYARSIIEKRNDITGIISCNDLMSVGLTLELTQSGLKIPENLSIVGFDDSFIMDILSTRLTTVSYDFNQIGIAAANMILEDLNNPLTPKRKCIFLPSLMQRNSVGEPLHSK